MKAHRASASATNGIVRAASAARADVQVATDRRVMAALVGLRAPVLERRSMRCRQRLQPLQRARMTRYAQSTTMTALP
jgi:hypothetical protein